ncbi:phosphate ABC transporter substrate-binding protein PhoT family (TC 3.A.1.7.1) [Clostridium sp. CAG:411]|jgi:phosphate transport system substrate-binding protein|nr:substrate-binding domain-containing protein [Lachnospiraceae bacterium]CDE45943.1 phosphate ABC transporter substrate-binding protein PhoT family (TC 3.A.1.7.1) [Clostridium sp. CAG:411]
MVKTSKKVRKAVGLALSALLVVGMVGCGNSANSANGGSKNGDTAISVVSREDGSGTRSAFVELTGVEEKDKDGNKIDNTTDEAIISNSTEIVMTTVAGNKNAVGYISLGSLNDTVKGVNIDGVEPTADNIVNGKYSLSRPFNIVTKDGLSDVAQDFISFIMSEDGQKIISENGYVEVDNTGAFKSNNAKGKIVIAGSSSVTPVMEKLQEAYKKINGNAEIELQESDSTTGVNAAADGTCDIGMASRALSDEESNKGLKTTSIAMDGIVVIVNTENDITDLTTAQVNDIFRGNVTTWDDVK